MCPPSMAIRPRNTGDKAFSVSSPLARPKQAAATALAREIGGVRQEAPSVRHMVIKSPRGSTTEMLILAPIASTLALAAARICSASASVKDAMACPPRAWVVLEGQIASALLLGAEAPEAGRPRSPVGNDGHLAPDRKALSDRTTVWSAALP